MRVLVCGDRNWRDEAPIERELRRFGKGTVVIHGGASGVDTIAGRVAGRLGYDVKEYPARWDVYGAAAGPIRNKLMLDSERIDIVLAFHPNLEQSKGTADMVKRAMAAQLPVVYLTK